MKKVTIKDLKTFGLIWVGIFVFIELLQFVKNDVILIWPLVISFLFISIIIINPLILTGFYKLFTKIGEFIGNIMSKIILIILFYGLFTLISIVLKILKKDLLNKKINKDCKTYWIERENQPGTLKNQF